MNGLIKTYELLSAQIATFPGIKAMWLCRLSAAFLASFSDQSDLSLECHDQLSVFLLQLPGAAC